MAIFSVFGSGLALRRNGNSPVTREVRDVRLPKSLGMVLLGIWLIVTGLLSVVSIAIPAIGTILAVLAIAAGVLILLGR